MSKENKFYDSLKDIFIGAKVEGESGYINLMRIKSNYYEKGVFPKLKKDIEEALKPFPDFREELFDKLYTFFNRYFSESGSIYFRHTPIHQNIYEKVYTDDKDVMLFWKTHMLYYVKTDRLFKNLEVEIDKFKFFFDVSSLEHKKAFEKKEIIYELKEKRKNGAIVFKVYYTQKGKKTKIDEIIKALKRQEVKISEDILESAFRVFEKQSEVDYFINKNAREFLKEQFEIWLYQYVFSGESEWTEKRIKQLQTLENISFKIIDFISQFEDELVKIWNKPKFVLNYNYVITLDRIADKNIEIVEKILKHDNFKKQLEEWNELGIIDDSFDKKKIIEKDLTRKHLNKKYTYLPIDTIFFKDLELEILGLFDDLDISLDGWLIKSENYQALNTILPKFKEKVQTIYIDPPFNKEQDADYFYSVKYKDSSWITLLENRLQLAKDILNPKGSIFVRCDYNGNMYVKLLMNEIFGEGNFRNEIIINRTLGKKKLGESFPTDKDSIFLFSKDVKILLKDIQRPFEKFKIFDSVIKHLEKKQLINSKLKNEILNILWLPLDHRPGERTTASERIVFGRKFYPPKGRHWIKSQGKINQLKEEGKIRLKCNHCGHIHYNGKWQNCPVCSEDKPIIEIFLDTETVSESWLDIPGYSQTWKFPTENSEVLLKRVIESTSDEKHLIMDFFLGIGTTTAVAHKLRRKWIGVEMGDHFYPFLPDTGKLSGVLPRMKEVLAGKGNHEPCGISREVNWKGGGFFKYYELEQYEDALRKVKYEDSGLFEDPHQDPYNQYVFMRDLKMLESLEVDYKNNKVKVDFSKLYKNIDIPETLSNLFRLYIKQITNEFVEFENGAKVNIKDLDYIEFHNGKIEQIYMHIKPLIWW